MPGAIYLFVSSSPDLVAEREALGQAVAELPISVGFEIMHTRPGEAADIGKTLAFILPALEHLLHEPPPRRPEQIGEKRT